jgi:hypothetical protein
MAPPGGSVRDKGLAVTRRLIHMLSVTADHNHQLQLQIGPKPAGGTSLGIVILAGQLSTADAGAYNSEMRAATESAVLDAVHSWALAHGADRDGWFLICVTWL